MSKEDQLCRPASDVMWDDELVGFVEGAAYALSAALDHDFCDKHYDPLTVNRRYGCFDSYAFDMKDGGRNHPISDYNTIREVIECLVEETKELMEYD